MKLPFLFLSVVLIPLANAQGNMYVSEHNLTYYLGEGDFTVIETLVFEKPGDPFTYEGSLHFLRGGAENVKVEGFPYSVTQGYPRKINLEFMISKGQKKRVTLSYQRSDLVSEREGVLTFRGLALGEYPWPVHLANINFIPPPGYQFGFYSPTTGALRKGELSYTVSIFENATAVLSGFPVNIEYADFKGLARKEMRLAESLISEAGFELERGNASVENAARYGGNTSQLMAHYGFAFSAFLDSEKNLRLAKAAYDADNYYRTYSSAKAASRLARLSIKEADKVRSLAELEIQNILERKLAAIENRSTAVEGELPEQPRETGTDRDYIYILVGVGFILALLLSAVAFKRKPRVEKWKPRDFAGIRDLKRRRFKGFERKIEGVKRRGALAAKIRDLMHKKESLEMGLEELRKSMAADKINKKTYSSRKRALLSKAEKIDSERSRLEAELEKIRKETLKD